MKAKIINVEFQKEFESKFGILYNFKVQYDDKTAFYSCKDKNQTKFIKGQEAEFIEETRPTKNGSIVIIKPMTNNFIGYNKAVKKEQTKYAGFAVSYVKDMIIAGKIDIKDWEKSSEEIFNIMVKLDKTLDS